MKTTTVTDEDLNLIDAMNGSGSLSQYDETTLTLKGALNAYNKGLTQIAEWNYIISQRELIVTFRTEMFEYENLPKPLNKYRVEQKLIDNAQVALVKVSETYLIVRFSALTFNIYGEPVLIKVNDPLSSIHGKTFNIAENQAVVIRDNMFRTPLLNKVSRLLSNMEKTLFQIEKNLTSSAPKGIVTTGNYEFDGMGDDVQKQGLEQIVNGQDTFYTMTTTENYDPLKPDPTQLFTPVELTDRTETLWKNYNNFKEQVKEIIGSMTNSNVEKRERTVVNEIDGQQGLSKATALHGYNIRVNDWNIANEVFGLNVQVSLVSQHEEDAISDEEMGDEE